MKKGSDKFFLRCYKRIPARQCHSTYSEKIAASHLNTNVGRKLGERIPEKQASQAQGGSAHGVFRVYNPKGFISSDNVEMKSYVC